MTNCRREQSLFEGLQFSHSASCYSAQLEALNFSLSDFICLLIWQVKNEALGHSSNSKCWRLYQLVFLQVLVSLLRAIERFLYINNLAVLLPYFFLDKKERKVQASSLPDCVTQAGIGNLLQFEDSYYELAFGRVIKSKGLRWRTLLRVIRGYMKALNFSLSDFICLLLWQVKNEALEQSFSSSSQHLLNLCSYWFQFLGCVLFEH